MERRSKTDATATRHLAVRLLLLGTAEMKVRLTKKYAEQINGIDLHGRDIGDVLELPPEKARLVLAEEWAIPERRETSRPDAPRRRADDMHP